MAVFTEGSSPTPGERKTSVTIAGTCSGEFPSALRYSPATRLLRHAEHSSWPCERWPQAHLRWMMPALAALVTETGRLGDRCCTARSNIAGVPYRLKKVNVR